MADWWGEDCTAPEVAERLRELAESGADADDDEITAVLLRAAGMLDEHPGGVLVGEGWWHPNAKSGQVHDHPTRPNGNWSEASHRLCTPVYTKRASRG